MAGSGSHTPPAKLIQLLTRIGRLDTNVLQEKYDKFSQVGKSKDNSQIANNKDNNIQGYMMFGFLAFQSYQSLQGSANRF